MSLFVRATKKGQRMTQSRARQREAFKIKHPAILPHDRSAVEKATPAHPGLPYRSGATSAADARKFMWPSKGPI
ncbi:hypothetical protein AGRO_0151 [Agrobacterium sp. ATCC 31749]|nr:hypothetical protein AGRO_0151 [Agrobacterium sp. ATCC 31749]